MTFRGRLLVAAQRQAEGPALSGDRLIADPEPLYLARLGVSHVYCSPWLKARTGGHEVINTIMMNYLALLLSSYLLNGPWKDPNPSNVVAQTPPIAPSARLTPIFEVKTKAAAELLASA